jgi:hypothetical protein
MGDAKDIILRPISAADANALVKRVHYSGKVVQNSQLHVGVFYGGRLEGAMQFGPSLDKRKIMGLVEGTGWNEFIELNRMAFSDALPRNSESRAIAIAMRILKKHAPHLKWVVSFADATQCGDGTIYRASGFALTGIKRNNQVWAAPSGERFSRTSLTDGRSKQQQQQQAQKVVSRISMSKGGRNHATGAASMKAYAEAGFRPLSGFQLRYIYFIDPTARERLTVPVLPFSKIDEMGARMYKGEKIQASEGEESSRPATSGEEGGASPTPALQEAP